MIVTLRRFEIQNLVRNFRCLDQFFFEFLASEGSFWEQQCVLLSYSRMLWTEIARYRRTVD